MDDPSSSDNLLSRLHSEDIAFMKSLVSSEASSFSVPTSGRGNEVDVTTDSGKSTELGPYPTDILERLVKYGCLTRASESGRAETFDLTDLGKRVFT